MGAFGLIKAELDRTDKNIALLKPSPNYDECEQRIIRTCLQNISKIVEEKEEITNNPISMTFIENVVINTGLKFNTVFDLLHSEWTYVSKFNEQTKWLSPEPSLSKIEPLVDCSLKICNNPECPKAGQCGGLCAKEF